ncbi:MAG: radical SAM protein [Candidatus Aminicenantes bacterium]|jgi:radical SAM superfamily enzyme YgiQ (UPF0313 family)
MEEMKVTLVYPCVRNGKEWGSLGESFSSLFVNHGLASLSACLKREGFTVDLIDYRELAGWREVEKRLAENVSDAYGIHMPTLDYYYAVKTGNLIKRYHPNALVAVGGPHPSITPETVAENRCFDYVVVGEGEQTFPQLLKNPTQFKRVVHAEHPDVNMLPIEDRELFNMKKILHSNAGFSGNKVFKHPFINVISGRGCVYRCGFCKPGEDLIFGKFRMRSLTNFITEIAWLNKRYNFQTLMIDDDSFTLNKKYLEDFAEWYKNNIGKPFICQTRADFVAENPDLVKKLKDAGLMMFFIGFESGSQRILDLMRKDTTVEQNFKAAETCKQLGIRVWANFMVGLPTETKQEMKATFNMIRKIKPEHPSGAFFTPIIGTELYNYCKQHDLLLIDDPAVLGARNPADPVIKGLDYSWMRKQMRSVTVPLWKRLAYPPYRYFKKTVRKVKPQLRVDV